MLNWLFNTPEGTWLLPSIPLIAIAAVYTVYVLIRDIFGL